MIYFFGPFFRHFSVFIVFLEHLSLFAFLFVGFLESICFTFSSLKLFVRVSQKQFVFLDPYLVTCHSFPSYLQVFTGIPFTTLLLLYCFLRRLVRCDNLFTLNKFLAPPLLVWLFTRGFIVQGLIPL